MSFVLRGTWALKHIFPTCFWNCHRFNQVSFYPDNWKHRVKIKRPIGSWRGSGEQSITSFHFQVSCEAFPLYFSSIFGQLREGVMEPVYSTIWPSRCYSKAVLQEKSRLFFSWTIVLKVKTEISEDLIIVNLISYTFVPVLGANGVWILKH